MPKTDTELFVECYQETFFAADCLRKLVDTEGRKATVDITDIQKIRKALSRATCTIKLLETKVTKTINKK